MSKSTKEKGKKRVVKVEAEGQVHIQASFNNIIISVTNMNGEVISWSSAGKMNFRGSKKNTPYAAQVATTACVKEAYDLGLRKADVYVKGPGAGREAAIRAVQSAGVEINMIYDITPIPHNGCRPPKKRRV
ncbi:MAG: 30S ribosomal protein S11 [Bacteroidia bacterium]|nr:30S ribosomal protein S11 [Bacteroidia bacterium]MDW8348001.1 30S ribosomal protein S11 [Bacteroidia bacterium]